MGVTGAATDQAGPVGRPQRRPGLRKATDAVTYDPDFAWRHLVLLRSRDVLRAS